MFTIRSLNRCKSIWVVRTGYCKHSLAVSDYLLSSFLVYIKVNKNWAHILIDTGVMRDFMLSIFTRKIKISLHKKSDIYKVTAIYNKLLLYNNRIINYETEDIRL